MSQPRKPAPGRVAAAKRASAARTRAKHQRWAEEIGAALQHIESSAPDGARTYLDCDRCGWKIAGYVEPASIAQLLADAIGHTCKDADGKGIQP